MVKIVVTGSLQSGKSAFIKCLDKKSVNVEARGQDQVLYTVGMDMANMKINGFNVFIFGTPGLLRFGVMRDVIANGADGILFFFDATAPEKDEETILMLNSIRKLIKPNTPIVFIVNKSELDGARTPEVIKAQNNLPEACKIFAVSCETGLNVEESMKFLINEIYDNYKGILAVMRKYETDIKGLADELKMDKSQMRDFLNNLEIKRFIEVDRIQKSYKVKQGLKNLT